MEGSSEKKLECGFTLIELMIVVAIVAITLLIAVPSMQSLLQASQLRTQAGRLMAAINLVRSEAIERNMPVSMCPSNMSLSGSAVCSQAYTDGWIIYSNSDRDSVVDAGIDVVIRVFAALPSGYTMTNKAATKNAAETITYLPDGSSRRTRTLMVCAPAPSSLAGWSVVMSRVGRPRLSHNWGQCP